MNKLIRFMLIMNLFVGGFVLGVVVDNAHPPLEDKRFATSNVAPQKEGEMLQEAVKSSLLSFFSDKAPERPSPQDRIKERDIHVLNNKVVIDVKDPKWARFTDTNSMDPVLDTGANAIEITPKSPDEIKPGDIVSYSLDGKNNIIHRVRRVGKDNKGYYYILKGDNNPINDPVKVRFNQIKRVVIAIIY